MQSFIKNVEGVQNGYWRDVPTYRQTYWVTFRSKSLQFSFFELFSPRAVIHRWEEREVQITKLWSPCIFHIYNRPPVFAQSASLCLRYTLRCREKIILKKKKTSLGRAVTSSHALNLTFFLLLTLVSLQLLESSLLSHSGFIVKKTLVGLLLEYVVTTAAFQPNDSLSPWPTSSWLTYNTN